MSSHVRGGEYHQCPKFQNLFKSLRPRVSFRSQTFPGNPSELKNNMKTPNLQLPDPPLRVQPKSSVLHPRVEDDDPVNYATETCEQTISSLLCNAIKTFNSMPIHVISS